MAPVKKIPVVRLPTLDAAARAQDQRPQHDDTDSEDDEVEDEPAPQSTIRVQIPALDDVKRSEYTRVDDPDAQAKYLRQLKEDPDFEVGRKRRDGGQPGEQRMIHTRGQSEKQRIEHEQNAAYEVIRADFERLYGSMPFDIKCLIACKLATKPEGARQFIDAYLRSKDKDFLKFKTQTYKAIETTEVVLSGFTHIEQYAGLHNAVMKRAKLLKVVYVGERTPTTQAARNDRHAQITLAKAQYNRALQNGGRLICIPPPLPMYTSAIGPADDFGLHGDSSQSLYRALRSFVASEELVLNFTSLLTFHHTDPNPKPGAPPFDYYYLVRNALLSACGISLYDQPVQHHHIVHWMGGGPMPAIWGGILPALLNAPQLQPLPAGGQQVNIQIPPVGAPLINNAPILAFAPPPVPPIVPFGPPNALGHQVFHIPQPAVHNANPHIRHNCPIRKFTLILPPCELARLATIRQGWAQTLDDFKQQNNWVRYADLLGQVPSFEVLREVFSQGRELHQMSYTTVEAVGKMGGMGLSEYEVDVQGGKVAYKEVGYEGMKEPAT